MRKLLLCGLAVAVAACGGDDTTCGTGTIKMGSMCVSVGDGGSDVACGTGTHLEGASCVADDGTTCGSGTHLDGMTCVPDDTGVAVAPTVASIDPPASGIAGSVLFTITGTGFAGSNVTGLHVYFGSTTQAGCEARVGATTATAISGEVPTDCTLSSSVVVTVQTNLGSATIPFQYEMIFAADGDGGGQVGAGGKLWVIDPFLGLTFDLGQITDANQNAFGFTGMDFAANGTLFAATTGDSPADAGVSQLLSIDFAANTVNVIGDAVDAGDTAYYLSDIKFVAGTLYGWGYWDDGTDFERTLVSISTTDGTVTPIGTSVVDDTFTGGLAVDANGALIGAADGAGADANSLFPTTGAVDTIDTATGNHSQAALLDWPVGSPINAMTTFQGQQPLVLGVVDNGTYGAWNQAQLFGETLAIIDVANESVQPVLELPAATGTQSHIDALAVPPATFTISRRLPARDQWKQLGGPGLTR
jgi:hypothetical protein